MRDTFEKALDHLPVREAAVLRLRFGMVKMHQTQTQTRVHRYVPHGASLSEVATVLKCTRARAQQLEKSAIKRLRDLDGEAGLGKFVEMQAAYDSSMNADNVAVRDEVARS